MVVKRRTSVAFTESAAMVLEDLASKTGKSRNEVLRDAIALEKAAQDTWQKGGRVIIERDGEKYEVLPR